MHYIWKRLKTETDPKVTLGTSISFFLKENDLGEKVKNKDFIMKVRSYKWIEMD